MGFGAELRDWRTRRRLSQMALALEAGASPRHVSFLETGRAKPSPEMVARLGDALDLPLAARNGLMAAAGFAARHPRSDLSSEHLGRIAGAMARVVDRHDPWPGFAVDGTWRLLRLNGGAEKLLNPLGLGAGDSLLAPFTRPGFARSVIQNWGEVGHHMSLRLAAESRAAGGVAEIDALVASLRADPDVAAWDGTGAEAAVLTTIYRAGDRRLAFFTTLLAFQDAQDVAVAEARVELMFPAGAETEAAFEGPDEIV
ncbi:MAG: helix-turn-helix domain-containing protein [Pseudomonadota bacterium]